MSPSREQLAVLLVNLGSPDAPTTPKVRMYLREFLSDRRVIEMHPALWRPILESMILRVRPAKSAEKYRTIWGPEKSPLLQGTIDQAQYVGQVLGPDVEVRYAMRYGSNGIASALDSLYADGYRRLLVVPLYPQYSATTVASVTDEVYRWNLNNRDQFALRVGRSFQTDPGYIEAMAVAIESAWESSGRPDFDAGERLLLSYHGIPLSMAQAGDPYPHECQETTDALRQRLDLSEKDVLQTFQSKFGPAPWLSPATIDTMAELGKGGCGRVDVICPGFVSDCLETLEEIDQLNRETFLGAGGREFNYIKWGNDSQPWLRALADVVRQDLSGWI